MTGDRSPGEHRFDYCPWTFWTEADERQRAEQLRWQDTLRGYGLRGIGERSFVSPLAAIHDADLTVGAGSYVAARVYLTDQVVLGDRTTVNPYATVRGRVRLGDGVRVGAHASLLGFNHSTDPAAPIHEQPLTFRGITVDDDVWIGSQAIVLDGVHIGAHSVIGAGAVVTRDVAPWSIMAGNPARRIRDRRQPVRRGVGADPRETPARFGDRVRSQAAELLGRYRVTGDGPAFVDQPGAVPTVRAVCDAVEVAALLLGGPPPQVGATELADWLADRQDPETGLVPQWRADGRPDTLSLDDGTQRYHILAVGYALDQLGSRFPHPVRAVHRLDAAALVSTLDALPWGEQAWSAGDWVDGYATGLYWNRATFGLDGPLETLFGWLLLHQDEWSGLWGWPGTAYGRLQPVNGYYRLTRGSFAQFGLPVPRPESTIDSVLAHTRDGRYFADGRGTACEVLDVIHPLWLCGQQTTYRREEIRAWAGQRLATATARWTDGAGFAFDPAGGAGAAGRPSLQGTEMWLAIIWLLADVLGESAALGYRPAGVHRPEPGPATGPPTAPV